MLEKKRKYYMELSDTITTFDYNNNAPLSNVNIQEMIMKLMMEDEEESITDANSITDDAFSQTSIPQRENAHVVFTS